MRRVKTERPVKLERVIIKTIAPELAAESSLVRRLGLFDTTMIVMGGIIGSGIFINPYVVAQQVSSTALILGAWAVGGLIALAGAFIYAELSSQSSVSGGQYVYLREALHPSLAFIYGWALLLVIQSGGMAAVAVTFAKYLCEVGGMQVSDNYAAWLAAIALALLTLINCFGVRAGGTTQNMFMILKLIAIAALVAFGLTVGGAPRSEQITLSPSASSTIWNSLTAFGAALIAVQFAYGGWQTACFVAGEVREPRKNLPRGLLLGVLGVILVYLSVNFVCVHTLGPQGLAQTKTPASAVMRLALGENGARFIAAGIAVSTLGFLSQSMLTAPRVYFAMAEDGLFFASLARLNRARVPALAIALQGVLATIIALWGRYEQILNYVVSVDVVFFALSAACIFVFRRRTRSSENMFRVPGHPFTTLFFIAACCAVVFSTVRRYPHNSLIGLGIMLAGLPVYLFWRMRRAKLNQQTPNPPSPGTGSAAASAQRPTPNAQRRMKTEESPVTHKQSTFMHWAKTRPKVKYDLALSGILNAPFSELDVKLDDLDLHGDNAYGYRPLVDALASHCRISPKCVVTISGGASMANHLAMAAALEHGDEVLIEQPTYEPILAVAEYLGAKMRRFPRRFENGFRVDMAELEKQITPCTRLIALTNLHNPSSALVDDATLRQIGEFARSVGARVLVDEVYLEAMFEDAPRSSVHLGPEFIATSSLTKGYGLSGLRCGWILAEPDLAEQIRRLHDIFAATGPYPTERLSVVALAKLPQIAARAKRILESNRAALNQFLNAREDIEVVRTDSGTTSFPRLRNGNVEELCALLHEKYETAVAPGRFFESPQHFRIGMCCDPEMFRSGVERLGKALDDLRTCGQSA